MAAPVVYKFPNNENILIFIKFCSVFTFLCCCILWCDYSFKRQHKSKYIMSIIYTKTKLKNPPSFQQHGFRRVPV